MTLIEPRQADAFDLHTGLDDGERKMLAEHLAQVLADTYVLMIKTHVYHWNVVGPHFMPLHMLTEAHYNDLFKAADVVAERIRALGHLAPHSIQSMLPESTVEEEQKTRSAEGMIGQLVRDHEKIAQRMRESAVVAEGLEDFVTTDMLTERLAFHEKAIWMLRAMISA
jgi:starvation-inducible DNA-binding protein